MKVSLTDSAVNDLKEVLKYYEERLVAEVGHRFVEEIIERIETLIEHPEIGRVVPEYSNSGIRELIHPPFRIVYLKEESSIFVVRVWRTERTLRLP